MSSRTILSESVWQVLNEDTRQYLNEWDQLGTYIKENIHVFEAELTADQIDAVFNNAEQYAVDSGKFTSKLGKAGNAAAQAGAAAVGGVKLGAGVVGKINQKINDLGKVIQDTTPVQGIDAAFEKAKKDLYDKLGGKDSKVNQVITKASQLAKDNPGKTKFLVGALTLAASLAAGPAGGAAAGYVLRGASDLLAGEKLSTAVGKGIKTAALGYLSGKAFEFAKEIFQDVASPEEIASVANDPEQVAAAAQKAGETITPRMPIQQLGMEARAMDMRDMADSMKNVGEQMGLKPPYNANFKMGVPVEINGVPVPNSVTLPEPVIPGQNYKELRDAWLAENGIAAPTDAGSAFDKLDAVGGDAAADAAAGTSISLDDLPVMSNGQIDTLSDQFSALSTVQQNAVSALESGVLPSKEFADALVKGDIDLASVSAKLLRVMKDNNVNAKEYFQNLADSDLISNAELVRIQSKLGKLAATGVLDSNFNVAFESIDVDAHNALYETVRVKYMSGLALTESEQQVLEIGPLAGIGAAAARGAKALGGAVAKGARAVGKQLGQTVTARKLKSLWKDSGSPTDAAGVSQVLSQAGLGANDIAAVAKASKVSLPAAPKAAKAAPGAKQPAAPAQPGQQGQQQQAAPAGAPKQTMRSKVGKAISGLGQKVAGSPQQGVPSQQAQPTAAAPQAAAPGQDDLDDITKARKAAGLDVEQPKARGPAPDAKAPVVGIKPKQQAPAPQVGAQPIKPRDVTAKQQANAVAKQQMKAKAAADAERAGANKATVDKAKAALAKPGFQRDATDKLAIKTARDKGLIPREATDKQALRMIQELRESKPSLYKSLLKIAITEMKERNEAIRNLPKYS